MNSIFGMFMESWILPAYCKADVKGFTLALQETRSIQDSMNIPQKLFIAYIYILL